MKAEPLATTALPGPTALWPGSESLAGAHPPGCSRQDDCFDAGGVAVVEKACGDRVELAAGGAHVVVDEDMAPGCPGGVRDAQCGPQFTRGGAFRRGGVECGIPRGRGREYRCRRSRDVLA